MDPTRPQKRMQKLHPHEKYPLYNRKTGGKQATSEQAADNRANTVRRVTCMLPTEALHFAMLYLSSQQSNSPSLNHQLCSTHPIAGSNYLEQLVLSLKGWTRYHI